MARRSEPCKAYPKWTQARFNAFIRSALRSASRKWPPKWEVKQAGKRPYKGDNPRQRYEYHCQGCDNWFPEKFIEMDHIVDAGSFTGLDDLGEFAERLFVGVEGWQRLCKDCHKKKTIAANDKRREEIKKQLEKK